MICFPSGSVSGKMMLFPSTEWHPEVAEFGKKCYSVNESITILFVDFGAGKQSNAAAQEGRKGVAV
jgi:hypothetical protein